MKIGILGAGQLGRMLALAGYSLGQEFVFYDPERMACAASLGKTFFSSYEDFTALNEFAKLSDIVTYEFENIPLAAVKKLQEQVKVFPGPQALEVTQDRALEKNFLNGIGVKTAPFAAVSDLQGLEEALDKLGGAPAVLKTARLGYDGKGQQAIMKNGDIASEAVGNLLRSACILEKFIPFTHEWSIIAARSRDGLIACYPLTRNIHHEGILRFSWVQPSEAKDELQGKARNKISTVMNELQYVGVLAMEFFEIDGELIVNEMAPRVHNSGHWTIEGAATSQFENHIRAISGFPLGSTEQRFPCCMVNIIGDFNKAYDLLPLPDVHLHLYGKSERPGRKVGHITICDRNEEKVAEKTAEVCRRLGITFSN
jgi:5-(carboxyamino)imidazole ribonucleotide synthase